MIKQLIIDLLAILLLGVGVGIAFHVDKYSIDQRMDALEKRTAKIEGSLKMYGYKVDDLALAYIDHFGMYPQKVRAGREEGK